MSRFSQGVIVLILALVALRSGAGPSEDTKLRVLYREVEHNMKDEEYEKAIDNLNLCLQLERKPSKINGGGEITFYLPYFKLSCAYNCLGKTEEADYYLTRAEQEALVQSTTEYHRYQDLLGEPQVKTGERIGGQRIDRQRE